MARLFSLWQKKRGHRTTGSTVAGGVGEALFFAAIFLVGAIALAALIASQLLLDQGGPMYVSGWLLWLVLLVLASFFLIGAAGIVRSLLQFSASAERRSVISRQAREIDLLSDSDPDLQTYPTIDSREDITSSPGVRLAYRLPSAETPFWRLLFIAMICVVWNVIAVSLIVLAVKRHAEGEPDWFLTCFLAPFVAVGFWAIYYFLRRLLLFTGIGPTNVEISDHPLYPRGTYGVFLSQSGQLRIQQLLLTLVCEEEAAYRHGTDVRSERQEVFRATLLNEKDFEIAPGVPFEKQVDMTIPAGAMHSFNAQCNAVRWRLVVRGRSRAWPTFERAFPIVVFPSPQDSSP
ncbi:hypothetical protein [Lignipirellula cremea]|uniref:Uncharacterized protein n=1 Tax=Lignipirellula cremea TaxID=2528010 RepID=A0A518DVP7_9BACT|nr:hypothetical protein [Lignipirellula cremea]QDU95905.1 hypothetical protein Pla8534_37240 [Lignipirellula cremea]